MPTNTLSFSQPFDAVDEQRQCGHEGTDIWEQRGMPFLATAPGVVARGSGADVWQRHPHRPWARQGGPARAICKLLATRNEPVGERVGRARRSGPRCASGRLSALVDLHFEMQRKTRPGWQANDPQLHWVDGVGRVDWRPRLD